MTDLLLIVTEDGYGRRVPVNEIRRTNRGAVGVRVSRLPVAVALVVGDDSEDELVLTTSRGKVVRIGVGSVPVRRRSDPHSGAISKGVPVVRLQRGDKVASAALSTPVKPGADATDVRVRTKMQAALREGEEIASLQVLHPLRELTEITPGGALAVDRDEWAASDVHAHSAYWCGHCGRQQDDPEAVYACIDQHVKTTKQ